MLPDLQLLSIAMPLSENAQHRRLGIRCQRLGLHRCGNEPFAGPDLESECHSQLCTCHPSWTQRLHGSPGKTFGSVTDSSAPESTTASTKRNPALGKSLAMARTDLVSSSFKYWTHGTRVHPHHSGTWLKLTFSSYQFGRPSRRVPFGLAYRVRGSARGAMSVRLDKNCEPVCRSFLRHRLNPTYFWLATVLLGLLFLLAFHNVLCLILFIGSSITQALSLPFAFACVGSSLCRHFHIQLFTLGIPVAIRTAVIASPFKPISAFSSTFSGSFLLP